MYGAILGDIVGSPYEYEWSNIKTKEFPLFSPQSHFTDDTVLTLAVGRAFLEGGLEGDGQQVKDRLIRSMRELCAHYPQAGYGQRFQSWLEMEDPQPYNSLGNGSAMRVSPAAWLFSGLEEVRRAARLSAEVTHNHPEGIKGAEATASAIWLAREGRSKEEIRAYVEGTFGYDLRQTCAQIRLGYRRVETCMGTVPQAITAFLEGESFEDVLRTAVSLGGDSDTIAAIAGSVAEGFYGIPQELKETGRGYLTTEMQGILEAFYERLKLRA